MKTNSVIVIEIKSTSLEFFSFPNNFIFIFQVSKVLILGLNLDKKSRVIPN